MLPSWTNLSLSQPRKAAGIYIGKRHLSAVVLAYNNGIWEEKSARVVALEQALFDTPPTPAIEADLAKTLSAVAEDIQSGFMPLRVALPDTVIRTSTLELDALPKTEKLQMDLLRWRFAKDLQRAEDTITCTGQALGPDNDKQLLLGQVMEHNWLDSLQRVFAQAKIIPWTVNAVASYRHNCYYNTLVKSGGALISIDPDNWGVQMWDSSKRLRYVRSKWREAALDYELIFSEVERAIRSHSHRANGYQIERLYLAGTGAEIEELRNVLDSKLSQSVTGLDIAMLSATSINNSYPGELLLARTAAANYEN